MLPSLQAQSPLWLMRNLSQSPLYHKPENVSMDLPSFVHNLPTQKGSIFIRYCPCPRSPESGPGPTCHQGTLGAADRPQPGSARVRRSSGSAATPWGRALCHAATPRCMPHPFRSTPQVGEAQTASAQTSPPVVGWSISDQGSIQISPPRPPCHVLNGEPAATRRPGCAPPRRLILAGPPHARTAWHTAR
jgi:hypothetical protein